MGKFFANGGFIAMSRKNPRVIWELRQLSETLDNLKHRTALEVCSPDGMVEKCVASERNTF